MFLKKTSTEHFWSLGLQWCHLLQRRVHLHFCESCFLVFCSFYLLFYASYGMLSMPNISRQLETLKKVHNIFSKSLSSLLLVFYSLIYSDNLSYMVFLSMLVCTCMKKLSVLVSLLIPLSFGAFLLSNVFLLS